MTGRCLWQHRRSGPRSFWKLDQAAGTGRRKDVGSKQRRHAASELRQVEVRHKRRRLAPTILPDPRGIDNVPLAKGIGKCGLRRSPRSRTGNRSSNGTSRIRRVSGTRTSRFWLRGRLNQAPLKAVQSGKWVLFRRVSVTAGIWDCQPHFRRSHPAKATSACRHDERYSNLARSHAPATGKTG